jgi:hypothetical protein
VVPVTIREVQPNITREIEETEIRRVIEPHNTTQVAEAKLVDTVAPVVEKPTVTVGPSSESVRIAAQIELETQPETKVCDQREFIVEKNPIVHEVVKKKIIEQKQPEIFQKTITPTVVHETIPVFEKVVIAPHLIYEVKRIHFTIINSPPNDICIVYVEDRFYTVNSDSCPSLSCLPSQAITTETKIQEPTLVKTTEMKKEEYREHIHPTARTPVAPVEERR